MFLTTQNEELLSSVIGDILPVVNLRERMNHFASQAEDKPLIEMNKDFLMYYLSEPSIEPEDRRINEVTVLHSESIMMELSLIKQELSEIKKMVLALSQLIKTNATIA